MSRLWDRLTVSMNLLVSLLTGLGVSLIFAAQIEAVELLSVNAWLYDIAPYTANFCSCTSEFRLHM